MIVPRRDLLSSIRERILFKLLTFKLKRDTIVLL